MPAPWLPRPTMAIRISSMASSWRGACFTASPDESSFLRRGDPPLRSGPLLPPWGRAPSAGAGVL